MFIKEVLHGLTMDDFDDETLATVNKFFENNLNVSETSRQLYIHRNTLVYRLDKLQKMTGLDLRNFTYGRAAVAADKSTGRCPAFHN